MRTVFVLSGSSNRHAVERCGGATCRGRFSTWEDTLMSARQPGLSPPRLYRPELKARK